MTLPLDYETLDPQIIEMYADGYSIREIGVALFCAYTTIHNRLRHNGVEIRARGSKLTPQMVIKITIDTYKRTGSVRRTATVLEVCPKTVQRRLKMGGFNERLMPTRCKNGHPFDEENTRYDKKGHRICRKCKSRVSREQRRKQRVYSNH